MTTTSMATVRWETKLSDGTTGNEVDDDGDGATGDNNDNDDDGNGDGAMGSGAKGYDDDDNDDGRVIGHGILAGKYLTEYRDSLK